MADFAKDVEKFYISVIELLQKKKYPFMVGGGIAVREYASDIGRPMKDLDLFVKAGDYPKILSMLKEAGFKTMILDERWLAKVTQGKYYIDIIFSSPNYMNPVDDSWLQFIRKAKVLGKDVHIIAPEELIWCKSFVQDRSHFDGADINHIILHEGKNLDWKRLLMRMENHWELLLQVVLNFRFVYPSERGIIPKWLVEELMERLESQLNNPIPKDKICRGPLLSRTDYNVDTQENNFQEITQKYV